MKARYLIIDKMLGSEEQIASDLNYESSAPNVQITPDVDLTEAEPAQTNAEMPSGPHEEKS